MKRGVEVHRHVARRVGRAGGCQGAKWQGEVGLGCLARMARKLRRVTRAQGKTAERQDRSVSLKSDLSDR